LKAPDKFEDLLKRDSHVTILDLRQKDWKEQIYKNLEPEFAESSGYERGEAAFLQVLNVAVNDLHAQVAVIEPYISTDWSDEYGALYCRAFQQTSPFAWRIHFFGKDGADITIRPEDLFLLPKEIQDAYLGFCVVRPIAAFRVGDTVLMSPCTIEMKGPGNTKEIMHLGHCAAPFKTSLLGNELKVKGMPFIQQDTSVGVCAESDLWMVARYLNKLGEVRRYRPSEITEIATRMLNMGQVREGLIDWQMVDALRQMGLNAVQLTPKDPDEAKDFLYTCVESSLPVITGIPAHVVVLIGHDYRSPAHFRGGEKAMSGLVNHFYVNDDARGPYIKEAVGTVTSTTAAVGKQSFLTLKGEIIDFCIVALPPRVHLRWEDVREHTKTWLRTASAYVSADLGFAKTDLWDSKLLRNLVTRTYLRRSRDFKQDLVREERPCRHPEFVAKYRCMQMPKYVWVVELGIKSKLEGCDPYSRTIVGEIVFDSTANRHIVDKSVLAFHLAGMMYVRGHNGDGSALIVQPDEKPYRPLLRVLSGRVPQSL